MRDEGWKYLISGFTFEWLFDTSSGDHLNFDAFIAHPSSFIPHPSSLIPHPSSFILIPSCLAQTALLVSPQTPTASQIL
jgi:hypothetical protein